MLLFVYQHLSVHLMLESVLGAMQIIETPKKQHLGILDNQYAQLFMSYTH